MILGVVSCVAAILVLGFGLIVGSSIEPDTAILAPATMSLQTPLPVRPMLPTFTPSGPVVIPPGVTEQPDAPTVVLSPQPGASPSATFTPQVVTTVLVVTPTPGNSPPASPTLPGSPLPAPSPPVGVASPTAGGSPPDASAQPHLGQWLPPATHHPRHANPAGLPPVRREPPLER